MQTITEDLLKQLKNTNDIQGFLNAHENDFIQETPSSFLNYMIKSKNVTVSHIAKASGVGEYVYKIFNNERKPSRNVLIAIAFGMQLSLEEVQLLLRISKFAILDSRDKRDSVIIYGFVNDLTVFKVDDLLADNNFLTVN